MRFAVSIRPTVSQTIWLPRILQMTNRNPRGQLSSAAPHTWHSLTCPDRPGKPCLQRVRLSPVPQVSCHPPTRGQSCPVFPILPFRPTLYNPPAPPPAHARLPGRTDTPRHGHMSHGNDGLAVSTRNRELPHPAPDLHGLHDRHGSHDRGLPPLRHKVLPWAPAASASGRGDPRSAQPRGGGCRDQ